MIDKLLQRCGGVATRATLLTVLGRGRLDHEIRSGRLASPYRRVWCRPWDADEPAVRDRAALLSVGAPAALSHASALHHWSLLDRPPWSDVYVTVSRQRCPRSQPGLVVHRATALPPVVRMDGLVVTGAAESVVAWWGLDDGSDRRGPAISAVRSRVAGPSDLQTALARHPKLRRRGEFAELVGLLAAGCESELEIWGHLHVFDVPGLRHGVRQRRVEVAGRRFRLDLAYDQERVAVEVDGARFHSSPHPARARHAPRRATRRRRVADAALLA